MQAGLRAHASALPPGSRQRRDAEERAGHISLEWLLSVMSHLHVNAFRCCSLNPSPCVPAKYGYVASHLHRQMIRMLPNP